MVRYERDGVSNKLFIPRLWAELDAGPIFKIAQYIYGLKAGLDKVGPAS